METLKFKNPVFKAGRNVTCRRGTRWDTLPKENVYIIDTEDPITDDGETKVLHVVDIETLVLRFEDLRDIDLIDEHDPACRSVDGLLDTMKKVYFERNMPEFDSREIVTLVSFNLDHIDVEK